MSEVEENLPIPRSLTSKVYTRMRTDIISGVLKPGQKLKIDDLIKTYEVGNSPVREALSLLTSDALVERLDQRGFRVVEVSTREFDELLKTRIWLEERALRESITNANEEWEESIILATYRLAHTERSSSSSEFVANEAWEDLHKTFHMALIAACGSEILLKICNQLYDQNTRYRHLTGPSAYPSREVNAEHGALSEAVLAGKTDEAVELLTSHYRKTAALVREKI